MPLKNTFKECNHVPAEQQGPTYDWRQCYSCLDELQIELGTARMVIEEMSITENFDERGILTTPKNMMGNRGQHFTELARFALRHI